MPCPYKCLKILFASILKCPSLKHFEVPVPKHFEEHFEEHFEVPSILKCQHFEVPVPKKASLKKPP